MTSDKATRLDSPPYVVDPEILGRFDARQTVFGRVGWDETATFFGHALDENVTQVIARGEAGYTRIDYARAAAAWAVADHFTGAYSWEKLGGPGPALAHCGPHRVTSSAEMSRQIKETARTYGADLVGITKLDRRWVYSSQRDGRTVEIPTQYEYAIVMGVAMDPSRSRPRQRSWPQQRWESATRVWRSASPAWLSSSVTSATAPYRWAMIRP